jgi:hypothetical protein
MGARRHKQDQATYRELSSYKERVQSFNIHVRHLVEYVRVQVELDANGTRTRRDIADARIKTLEKAIAQIRGMV